jgi:hypothetical protein
MEKMRFTLETASMVSVAVAKIPPLGGRCESPGRNPLGAFAGSQARFHLNG